MYHFIISGGNFRNKGAQAMVYITCSQLRTFYPNCKITVLDIYNDSKNLKNIDNLKFSVMWDSYYFRMIFGGNILECAKGICAVILKKSIRECKEFRNVLNDADGILDISGYALGSNWPERKNLNYIYLIEMAKRKKIPIYLLPQSFGPFLYTNMAKGKYIEKKLKNVLNYPRYVFAREEEGKELLEKNFKLKNVLLANDIVLGTKKINFESILKIPEMEVNCNINTDINGIALIPSVKIVDEKNEKSWLGLKGIIDYLLKNSKEDIYLIYHAKEDRKLCEKLKNLYSTTKRIILYQKEVSFIEFDSVCKKFKFIISSRYHSIVLAYRNRIPCIVLGWSIKYFELGKNLGQEKYIFDYKKIDKKLYDAIDRMLVNYENESKIINIKMNSIKEKNAFDVILKDFDKINSEG